MIIIIVVVIMAAGDSDGDGFLLLRADLDCNYTRGAEIMMTSDGVGRRGFAKTNSFADLDASLSS
jgi:hypothetical protein